MGYFLSVSGGSMFLTIISSLVYAIGVSKLKSGELLFSMTILSAIFITLTGIFHVLALRRYSRKPESGPDRPSDIRSGRGGSSVIMTKSQMGSPPSKTESEAVARTGSVVTGTTGNQQI
jgi:hypothetical protein